MGRAPALAPFSVRSFRFQWPADLVASWAFEMETLALGWYVLSETGSVELLVLFAALIWLGSLFSPFVGLVGDRVGFRVLLCATRAFYAVLAGVLAALILAGTLAPWHVFVATALAGSLRPSDSMLRNVLVGQTMQPHMLMGALGISRTTSDSAKIAGALAGTGVVAALGMGPAYVLITLLHAVSFGLSLGVARGTRNTLGLRPAEVLAHVKDALHYIWSSPDQLGAFSVAFIANLLAFPFFLGLLPYAAKEFYAIGLAGLGWLAAAFACGALAGSLVVGAGPVARRAGRMMLAAGGAWFAAVLLMGQIPNLGIGLALIFAAGCLQSLCLVPLAAVMLRSANDEMRGRVMGMRSLAVWGLPLGLLATGPLIAHVGFAATTAIYGTLGISAMVVIGVRCRRALWDRAAVANSAF